MSSFSDIVLEESLAIAEALHIFHEQGELLRGAGEDLLESSSLEPMRSSRHSLPRPRSRDDGASDRGLRAKASIGKGWFAAVTEMARLDGDPRDTDLTDRLDQPYTTTLSTIRTRIPEKTASWSCHHNARNPVKRPRLPLFIDHSCRRGRVLRLGMEIEVLLG